VNFSNLDMALIGLFLAGAAFLLLNAFRAFFSVKEVSARDRLAKLKPTVDLSKSPEWERKIALHEAKQRQKQKVDLKTVLLKLTGSNFVEKVERDLRQADMPMSATEWLLVQVVATVVPALLIFSLYAQPIGAGVAFAVGLFVPGIIVRSKTKGKTNKFNDQLADFLVLVVNSLRSGQTFLQAVSYICRDASEPIKSEFSLMLQETNLGVSVEQAMENLKNRIPSPDLEITCTAFVIQKSVGGNLGDVLEKVAATIRERQKLAGQIKALTAQGMMSGMIVGLLPVLTGFGLYCVNKPYIMVLFTHPMGKMAVGGAIISEFLGAFIIKKIITIEM